MRSLKAYLELLQRSRVGLFIKKVMDDQAPNLAALLAWGTLSALLPLTLGVLSVAGLILRDQQRLDQVYSTLLLLVPAQAAGPVGDALQGVRQASAAPVGIIALVLLVFNGSSFFANMESVFDQAYHVESRHFVMQRLVAIAMLVTTTILVVLSTLTVGISSLISSVPLGLSIGPGLAQAISWVTTVLSVLVLFLLIYRVLPNARQGWRDVLPGALLSLALVFVTSLVFPLYVALFPPNQAYAVFGVFLVFTFWLYLLGFVFVLGAELNAFLQQPARTVALAEATDAAQHGRAAYDYPTGKVRAEVTGSAPALLGSTKPSSQAQVREQEPAGRSSSLAGRVLGLVGLIVAALLLRGADSADSKATNERAHA